MSGAAAAQNTAATQAQKTPAEMARAIANTITATTHITPGSPITFVEATSHDNVVEIRFVVTDAAAFARFKANAEPARIAKTSYYCNESRIDYLKQGVVIHDILALSGGRDQVETTIDKSSCDRLPRPAQADAKTLTELALAAAKTENEPAENRSQSAFHFAGATAHQGVVDLRFVFRDAAAAAAVDQQKLVAVLSVYMCTKYRDSIVRGLVFHPVFALANDPPTIDFIIDRSKC